MYALGIDLGTVFTAAATWRDGHAEIATLGSRAATIPSVVLLREDDSFLTGEAAHRRALVQPARVAREFKRRFGDATPIMLGGSPYSAEALMARLLETVVAEVSSREGGPPGTVCLCHPANWGPYKTDLLRQSVRMADLRAPVTFAIEPAAAAAYYSRQQRIDPGSVIAVYDLGGGTFDAAVLRKTATGFEIMGRPEGIEHLGGADFDAAVFHHVRSVIGPHLDELDENAPTTIAAVARLREECTEAKETLSSDTDTTIPVLLPNYATEVRLTRAELERMLRPSLYDTIGALQRAIRSAGVDPEDLHSVLLIGGSSRMPLVAQLVGAELDRPVAVDAHPKHAVALGAAWVAGEQLSPASRRDTGAAASRSSSSAPEVAPSSGPLPSTTPAPGFPRPGGPSGPESDPATPAPAPGPASAPAAAAFAALLAARAGDRTDDDSRGAEDTRRTASPGDAGTDVDTEHESATMSNPTLGGSATDRRPAPVEPAGPLGRSGFPERPVVPDRSSGESEARTAAASLFTPAADRTSPPVAPGPAPQLPTPVTSGPPPGMWSPPPSAGTPTADSWPPRPGTFPAADTPPGGLAGGAPQPGGNAGGVPAAGAALGAGAAAFAAGRLSRPPSDIPPAPGGLGSPGGPNDSGGSAGPGFGGPGDSGGRFGRSGPGGAAGFGTPSGFGLPGGGPGGPGGPGAPGGPATSGAPTMSADLGRAGTNGFGGPNRGAPIGAAPAAPAAPVGPASSGNRGGAFRDRWVLLSAAAVVAVIVVALGSYLAGSKGLFSAANSATPSPSSAVSGEATTVGTSGTPIAGATTAGAAAAVPSIYTCPTSATAALYVCLSSVKLVGAALNLTYTANYTLTAGQDPASHHMHLFLANPGPNGTTVPPDTIIRHVPNAGSWFNIYSKDTTVIDANTEQGGQKLGLQSQIDKYSLLCVRVASGLHELATDKSGGLRTGNCLKITK